MGVNLNLSKTPHMNKIVHHLLIMNEIFLLEFGRLLGWVKTGEVNVHLICSNNTLDRFIF